MNKSPQVILGLLFLIIVMMFARSFQRMSVELEPALAPSPTLPASPTIVAPTIVAAVSEPTLTLTDAPLAAESSTPTPTSTAVPIPQSTPTEPPPTTTPTPMPEPDWLIYLNQFRQNANLPPLVEDPALSAGSSLHSMYMVLNDNPIARYQAQDAVLYSPAGNRAAQNSNIFAVPYAGATPGWALNFWLSSPFDALAALNPQLQAVGYADFEGPGPNVKMAAVLDVESGVGETAVPPAYPLAFPADGGQTWVVRQSMIAFPDTLANCPDYARPTGPPIILQMGDGSVTPHVTGHSLRQEGTTLETCLFDETTYSHENPNTQAYGRSLLDKQDAIIILPRFPLAANHTYSVSVDVNGETISWQFDTIPSPEIDWDADVESPATNVFIWPAENLELAGNYRRGDLIYLNQEAGIRAGPSIGYEQLRDDLLPGTTVRLTGRNGVWLQITGDEGEEGWILASSFLRNVDFSANDLPFVHVDIPDDYPIFAYAAGFGWGGQSHDLENLVLMRSLGMTWVKIQQKWRPGSAPEELASRIQLARAMGFKVLLALPGDPYPTAIDFEAYTTFLSGVAALNPAPNAIEVWNEMNLDIEWPAGSIDPEQYVNLMLKPAYHAIKRANPRIMVISGAPAPTGFHNGTNVWADDRYLAGMAQAGAADYMDCVGMHYNAGATAPNETIGHPAGGHSSWYFEPALQMVYYAFGGSKPICITELGYLSGEGYDELPEQFWWARGTTIEQQGEWLGEAIALARASWIVQQVIVFNVDIIKWENSDPQSGYAIIRPDGRCSLCEYLSR
ncbi:MAG: hypothetical protein GY803_02535 [Chloroflexi bacterium]|nr:hypothetical protein [Chloroflexota bacterium]